MRAGAAQQRDRRPSRTPQQTQQAEAGADGKLVDKNLKVSARDHTNEHAADCKM